MRESFTPPRPKRRVYANAVVDYYIAESPAHAAELYERHSGQPYPQGEDGPEDGPFVAEPPARVIRVGFDGDDDARRQLDEAARCGLDLSIPIVSTKATAEHWLQRTGPGRVTLSAPASWWAGLPAGFLCSTEF